MSSIPVNNNLNVLANIVNQTQTAPDGRNALSDRQEELIRDSFDVVMNRVNSKAANQMNVQETKSVAAVDGKTMSAGIAAADSSKKNGMESSVSQSAQNKPSQKTEENVKDASEQAGSDKADSDKAVSEKDGSGKNISDEEKAAVTDAGEKLVEEVADEMGITVEEVEEVMEILGLSAVQLLNPEDMQNLLLALSGNEDSLSIITDGELYGHLQNVFDMVSDALEDLQMQLGLSEEELGALIADMAVVENEAEPEEITEGLLAKPEEPEVNLEGMKDYAVTVHRDGETVEVKVKVDDVSGEQTAKEEVKAAPETQADPENKSENKNMFKEGRDESKGEVHTAGNFVMQSPIEQPSFNEIPQQPVMERYVSTEDIMNQIMEFMKISIKGDVQELEMQLHPASLGNIHIQLAAKEGMVTAQFIAQNETVKAAIETQLVQLKTQFEEQGIKVDEVEVTVGDYRFEHSFSGNEENTEKNEENGKKSRRSINLSELDLEELPEDMDDSERIAAEMMAQSGNMVDYTA